MKSDTTRFSMLSAAIRSFLFLFYFTFSISPGHAHKVIASIPPVASLIRAIAGENISIDVLVDNFVSPHVYALKPSDLQKISLAEVIFWIGPSYEAFLVKPLENYRQKSVMLMKAPNVHLYPLRSSDDHHHGGCPECAPDPLSLDGHIWLDPDNGFHIAEEITHHLIKLDPHRQQEYKNRLQKLKKNLRKAKKEMQAMLAPYESQSFLVFHDGYQYFEKAFNLEAGQAVTLIPDLTPSAKRLSALKELIRSKDIRCLFAESQFSPRLLKTLAGETNLNISILDPLGTPQMSYEDLLFSLTKSFSSCLGAKP